MDKKGKATTKGSATKTELRRSRKRVPRWVKITWIGSFSTLIFAVLVVGFVWFFATPRVNLSMLDQSSTPTEVFDRYGQLAFKIQPAGIQQVPLKDIPLNAQQALIATEDAGFYHNFGFSIKGYFRAAFHDLLHRDTGQGASTITQQLAKFVYLNDNKTIGYKLEELLLSIQISRQYTKQQILDMYFNHVYFGNGATGISQAAYTYFGLKPSQMNQMTLPQSALLAGLPQAPSLYDPLVNPKLALQRRNEVLQRMEEQHYISYATMVKTQKEPLELHPKTNNLSGIPPQYDYYRDFLYQELNQLHLSTQMLSQGGVKIYTSLDPQLQMATYNVINDSAYYPTPLSTATEEIEGAATFIDPHTGGIMALVGGRQNEYTYRGFDYAVSTQRSPGSAMKPLVVYGPALQSGQWNANSALKDGVNNQLSFGSYTVSDWETHPTENGYVTLRWALAESWNVPAVWLLDKIGIQTGIDFAEKTGINLSSPANQNLTIALGNIHPGISPLQLADAYCSFDDNGVRMPAHLIDRIINAQGQVIYQNQSQPVTVMSPSTATQMVALLRNNVVNGIVSGAAVPGHEVAGKTGSVAYTNTSHTDSDLWVAAFTPNVVGAVWEGYPDTTLANSLPQWSSSFPPRVFSAILSQGLPSTGGSFDVAPAAGPDFPGVVPGQSAKKQKAKGQSTTTPAGSSQPTTPTSPATGTNGTTGTGTNNGTPPASTAPGTGKGQTNTNPSTPSTPAGNGSGSNPAGGGTSTTGNGNGTNTGTGGNTTQPSGSGNSPGGGNGPPGVGSGQGQVGPGAGSGSSTGTSGTTSPSAPATAPAN
ncbi:transglycosylase domain-containing protein [Sulfoacidibacillus ferrooxidans]|uniref:Monofunctional glycosyltransferase n=1 Tax=Sulfoacidibacillus ferrooxidans TaxID=2005001 RepID=A0A9X1V6Y4_9BACL|nr:transglycosylase domain-containing protein [Sulfoacidibacillus ferrooxidans]MCI0182776.1 Monofunctional glycosyltransferase [Sulfoacidibacillus ferrooxidans]